MKKYLQITIVLIIFFVIVFIRRQISSADFSSLSNSSNDLSGLNNQSVADTSSNNSPVSTSTSSSPSATTQTAGKYKNGTYDGSVENAYYGNVQVRVTISGGKITGMSFPQYPSDNNTSNRINNQALPMLRSQAIQAQSAQVDGVSGASYTTQAFESSLSSALQQAS